MSVRSGLGCGCVGFLLVKGGSFACELVVCHVRAGSRRDGSGGVGHWEPRARLAGLALRRVVLGTDGNFCWRCVAVGAFICRGRRWDASRPGFGGVSDVGEIAAVSWLCCDEVGPVARDVAGGRCSPAPLGGTGNWLAGAGRGTARRLRQGAEECFVEQGKRVKSLPVLLQVRLLSLPALWD